MGRSCRNKGGAYTNVTAVCDVNRLLLRANSALFLCYIFKRCIIKWDDFDLKDLRIVLAQILIMHYTEHMLTRT